MGLVTAACTSAYTVRDGAADRDQLLAGTWQFNGNAQGVPVSGMISFYEDGSFEVISSHGTCTIEHKEGRPVRHARGNMFSTSCGELRLDIPIVQGRLDRNGEASIAVHDEVRTQGRCLQFDPESGNCLAYDTELRTRTRWFSGRIVLDG